MSDQPSIERQAMDMDIVCVGFGPATAGFLNTLSRGLVKEDGTPAVESKVVPGMPPQVVCYERADDIGFGVSGVATKGTSIKESFPDLDVSQIPMAAEIKHEKLVYLLDPKGTSRRPGLMKAGDVFIRGLKSILPYREHAMEMPFIPSFFHKKDGLLLTIGQFQQWVGSQLMGSGLVQIWPGTPVDKPLMDGNKVTGVQLTDQGTDKKGNPEAGYMPGMNINAQLTVLGDGPVGPVGRHIDNQRGMPQGHHRRDWAVGMKMVVDLPENHGLEIGTALHTLGYPEPEIFGFLYVYPDNTASLGIFVPSWFDSPVRTAYRYLQHWMLHPYLWKHLEGGTMRSWGAKSLQESGRRGEPFLVGDGYARIGEGSGSTNVLTGSGVDEAWSTGTMLAQAVLELYAQDKPFTQENLEAAYVQRRRESDLEKESKVAEKSRDGFARGVIPGLIGMGLSGLTKGRLNITGPIRRPYERIPSLEEYCRGRIPPQELEEIRKQCTAKGTSLHNAVMDRLGWPSIPYDGKLLVSHQDALLMGGKVQANPGYRDHVIFKDAATCEACNEKICVEACSGQAITLNPEGGVPLFDREKCVHCGACLWNCSKPGPSDPEETNVDFQAGSGGLHSAEN